MNYWKKEEHLGCSSVNEFQVKNDSLICIFLNFSRSITINKEKYKSDLVLNNIDKKKIQILN